MQHAFKFTPSAEGLAKPDPASAKLPKVEYDFPAPGETPNGIVLAGEAPGAEEARLGHPFVGRSGQLLDKILEQAGIARKQCLIANSFRFQPPGNKIDHFFISRRAAKEQGIAIDETLGQFGSAWCRAEFAGELQYLRKVLEKYSGSVPSRTPPLLTSPTRGEEHHRASGETNSQHDRKDSLPLAGRVRVGGTQQSAMPEFLASQQNKKIIIVALGRTALWALTGENGLMEKLGKPLPCRLLPGASVIPTFHPSFILRGNWARQDEWLGHFAAAKKFIV
jgi:uracil-DNA glycosylase